jgi:N,N'-diacetyllegionaminate synthase
MIKIIAEVANVHEGEFDYMLQLVKKLANTKINGIKFQYVIPSEFGDENSENYIELDRLKFTYDEFVSLLHACPQEMAVYYDIFAVGSFNQVLKLKNENPNYNIAGVKLHVTNSMDFNLIRKAADNFNSVFISISGLTAIEINRIVLFAKKENIFDKIILVYGVQNYPTKPESIKINKLSELKKIFDIQVSLSDHLDGDNPIAADMISYAQLLGYDYIEKHVTLDRSRRLDDDHAALTVEELSRAIEKLEILQSTFASNVLSLSEDEIDYRNKAKQAVYAAKEIAAHNRIDFADVVMKRQEGADRELNLLNISEVLGTETLSSISSGIKLNPKHLKKSIKGYILVRSASNRHPGKCYEKAYENVETLSMLIQRLKKSHQVNDWILCTTSGAEDDGIENIAIAENIKIVRGSENIFERLNLAFETFGIPEIMLRITADNVFIDAGHIDNILPEFIEGNYDYYRHSKVIDGCDFEFIKYHAFESLDSYFSNFRAEAEYMTLYLTNSYFNTLPAKEYTTNIDFEKYRFTLDYAEDLENIRTIIKGLGNAEFNYAELCNYLAGPNDYKSFVPNNKAFNIRANKKILF